MACTQWFPGTPMEGVNEVPTGNPAVPVVGQIDLPNGGVLTMMPGDWVSTVERGGQVVYASEVKGPGNDKPVGYWSDLLRGYELVNGLEIPRFTRTQVKGRERELQEKWNHAPAEDRAFVEAGVREQNEFIRTQT